MYEHTRPADLDAQAPDERARFRVQDRAEVLSLLRQVRDSGTPVVLAAPAGSAVVATLWSLDAQQGRLNFTADSHDPQLQSVVDADEVSAVAYLDAVKLQFDLQDLLVVRAAASTALQAGMPSLLYRFQRRSSYRVRTLDRHSPTARLRHPAIPDMCLTLRVTDVSIGGCALLLPADVPPFEPGLRLQGVQIELDADTRFAATLQIQHLSSVSDRTQGLRVGCEWVTLERDGQRLLQRCIDQTQKRRRLLSLD